jgi:hypothetical protein
MANPSFVQVNPGTVDEKKINKDRAKLNRFKKIENCNYAVSAMSDLIVGIITCFLQVELGKSMGLSLPGLGGIDIANGNPKLVIGAAVILALRFVNISRVLAGFVWQLMRMQTLNMLKAVGGGHIPKDNEIIDWVSDLNAFYF